MNLEHIIAKKYISVKKLLNIPQKLRILVVKIIKIFNIIALFLY